MAACPSNSTVYRTRDQLPMKLLEKGKEQSHWNLSLGHPQPISEWIAELDVASSIEFETLDSKIAKRIMEDDTRRFQEEDQFLGEDSVQEQVSNAYKKANYASDMLVLQQNSGAYDGLE